MAGAKKKVTKRTIKPGEDIASSHAEDLKKKLLRAVKQGIKDLTIDLSGVDMIDPVGLGVLIAAQNSLEDVGGSLKMKNVSGEIRNFMKSMGLDRHFHMRAVEP